MTKIVEPKPECPICKSNEHVIKNGAVERKGQAFQLFRCKKCSKTFG